MKQNVSTPEGVLRLFDLVRVKEERMRLAFFAALGNTVVAKDLDQVGFIIFVTSCFHLHGLVFGLEALACICFWVSCYICYGHLFNWISHVF